jgi:hypothetical protein
LHSWQKAYRGGNTSVHGERDTDELGSGRKTGKRGELALPGVRVRGCTGAWVCTKERMAHTDVKTAAAAGTATTT